MNRALLPLVEAGTNLPSASASRLPALGAG